MINGWVKDVRDKRRHLKFYCYFSPEECIASYKEVMPDIITLLVMLHYITCYAPLQVML